MKKKRFILRRTYIMLLCFVLVVVLTYSILKTEQNIIATDWTFKTENTISQFCQNAYNEIVQEGKTILKNFGVLKIY